MHVVEHDDERLRSRQGLEHPPHAQERLLGRGGRNRSEDAERPLDDELAIRVVRRRAARSPRAALGRARVLELEQPAQDLGNGREAVASSLGSQRP